MAYELSEKSQEAIRKTIRFFEPYDSSEVLRSRLSSINNCPYVAYESWLFDFGQAARSGSVSLVDWDVGATEYGLGYIIKDSLPENNDGCVAEKFLQITIKWNNYAFSLAMLLIYDWSIVQISENAFCAKYDKLIG